MYCHFSYSSIMILKTKLMSHIINLIPLPGIFSTWGAPAGRIWQHFPQMMQLFWK